MTTKKSTRKTTKGKVSAGVKATTRRRPVKKGY